MTLTIDLRVLTPQKCVYFHDFPLLFRSCFLVSFFDKFLHRCWSHFGMVLALVFMFFGAFVFDVLSNGIFMALQRVLGRKACSSQVGA